MKKAKLKALSIFMDKCNTDLLSKKEILIGVNFILISKSKKAKRIYFKALEIVYTLRSIKESENEKRR